MNLATLQPLLDKIASKMHSWTVKYLSFAGKVRLVASVIYGMVNFWSAVFVLPKAFYTKVDSLCAAFLWRNRTSNATGSRVAWIDICKPKSEGGLGLRRLEDFEMVFRLKRIWNFFSVSGSIWVAWLKNNLFQRKSFWLTQDSARFSATVRSMLQLRHVLSNYMRCVVGDGEAASFWFDSWTNLGPLFDVAGQNGPRSLRVRKDATVRDATRNGSWSLPAARSSELQSIQIAITSVAPPLESNGQDVFQWRKSSDSFGDTFSSKITWEHMRNPAPTVFWNTVIWFKESIPRNSFMAWLALLRRMPTKDRLRRWGLNVPGECVLCSTALETHHHLFFECSFSSALWKGLAAKVWPNPPSDLHCAAAWINTRRSSASYNEVTILKLLFQSTIYIIWKERNARVFTTESSTVSALLLALDRLLRDRLLAIPTRTLSATSLLEFYFLTFHPP